MAKRKRKRSRKKPQQDYPGWVWMLFGLSIGLSVAFAIYMKDREASGRAPSPAPIATASTAEVQAPQAEPEEQPERRFDFYDMLPNFEVIIPEQEPDVRQDPMSNPIEQPGVYVLQAGSFIEFGDADRRRAQLALLGVESRIQRVSIDDKTYHRVRIGPTRDLERLNTLRARLREAEIDVLRIRLGD
ncbi:MAG: SPOR domain-containing protein [Woeseiaceae bacterium]|nr:SPOR domain-containing protein [Woeseiaceae bacterium]